MGCTIGIFKQLNAVSFLHCIWFKIRRENQTSTDIYGRFVLDLPSVMLFKKQ